MSRDTCNVRQPHGVWRCDLAPGHTGNHEALLEDSHAFGAANFTPTWPNDRDRARDPHPRRTQGRGKGMERKTRIKQVGDRERDRMEGMRYLAAERIYSTIEATGVFRCEAFCGKEWDDPQTALNECQVAHIEPRGPASAVKRSRFFSTSEHPGNLRVVCSDRKTKCNRAVDARRSDDDLHFSAGASA